MTKPIREPKEIHELIYSIDKKGVRRNLEKAFRNLLTYLETIEGYPSDFIDAFRRVVKVERAGVREIYITTNELVEAYKHILPHYRTLFKLIVYSGIRLEHAVELLGTFNPDDLVVKDDLSIARYPIAWISKGQKRSYWAYFPIRFVDELERIELKPGTAKEGIRYGRVSASTIRKWNFNFLIENGVPESVADFIQGRASVTVGSSHYLAKTRQADMFYSKIVDKFPI